MPRSLIRRLAAHAALPVALSQAARTAGAVAERTAAVISAFTRTDAWLREQGVLDGTTVTTAAVKRNEDGSYVGFFANAGDSRALALRREGRGVLLATEDHKHGLAAFESG